jgi:cobyric acid synthase
MGTYLHGLFQNESPREALLHWLADRKGTALLPAERRDDPFDRLADGLSDVLDWQRVRSVALG